MSTDYGEMYVLGDAVIPEFWALLPLVAAVSLRRLDLVVFSVLNRALLGVLASFRPCPTFLDYFLI